MPLAGWMVPEHVEGRSSPGHSPVKLSWYFFGNTFMDTAQSHALLCSQVFLHPAVLTAEMTRHTWAGRALSPSSTHHVLQGPLSAL